MRSPRRTHRSGTPLGTDSPWESCNDGFGGFLTTGTALLSGACGSGSEAPPTRGLGAEAPYARARARHEAADEALAEVPGEPAGGLVAIAVDAVDELDGTDGRSSADDQRELVVSEGVPHGGTIAMSPALARPLSTSALAARR